MTVARKPLQDRASTPDKLPALARDSCAAVDFRAGLWTRLAKGRTGDT
jgi:hypothetical protein